MIAKIRLALIPRIKNMSWKSTRTNMLTLFHRRENNADQHLCERESIDDSKWSLGINKV